MTAMPKHKMTADEFLLWVEKQPAEAATFELWDGDVIVRHGSGGLEEGELAEHWDAKGAMFVALRESIKRVGMPCFAAVDGPLVRLSPHRMARPDVLVYCGPKLRGTREVLSPTIIVEVLSPSTEKRDHGVKREGYFTLPSLWHYLIVDPNPVRLIHHMRREGRAPHTEIVTGPHLQLDPPGLDVDLTEVLTG